jgi:hypothetical protein
MRAPEKWRNFRGAYPAAELERLVPPAALEAIAAATAKAPRDQMAAVQAAVLGRGLSKDQLAVAADGVWTLLKAERLARITKEDVCRLAGVSHTTVGQVAQVRRESPELLREVASGKTKAQAAYYIVKNRRRSERAAMGHAEERPPTEMFHEYSGEVCRKVRLLPRQLEGVYNSVARPKWGLVNFVAALDKAIGRARLVQVAKKAEAERLRQARLGVKMGLVKPEEAELDVRVWGGRNGGDQ